MNYTGNGASAFCLYVFGEFNDALNRANLSAKTASDAFFIIYLREIVFNVNCVFRTTHFTFFASNTAVCTFFANGGAFFLVTAHNRNLCICGNEGDDALGAGLNAKTAADAELFINSCNAVFNADGAFGANGSAIAATDTAVYAGFGAAVDKTFGFTALDAFVNGFIFRRFGDTVAVNERHAAFHSFCFNAEDSGNFFRNRRSTRNAKVCLCALFDDGFCVTVAARVSARAAVCAGQTFTNG